MDELSGGWMRLDEPPPHSVGELAAWLFEHHRAWLHARIEFAKQQAAAAKNPALPAVLGFVYPDIGPRAETHDAWLFVAVDLVSNRGHYARSFPLQTEERWLRQPQLRPLADKNVTLVGVGALGSQIADMLAKAGVGRMYLVDYDIVTHGNRVRHQLDLRDVGLRKVEALRKRLLAVNPWCSVDELAQRVGTIGGTQEEGLGQTFDDLLFERFSASDLIINASAHSPTGRHLSEMAHDGNAVALHAWVSAGAWGCRALLQRPGHSGCWQCLALAQKRPEKYETAIEVPNVASDPDVQQVSERGCADVTFTGPGFELAESAAVAARIATQSLLAGTGSYPEIDFDLATVSFRSDSRAQLVAEYTQLPPHPDCSICRRRQ